MPIPIRSQPFPGYLLRKKYAPETANALRELFQWCLQDGQLYAPDLGYIQLPASVAEKLRRR